MFGRDGCPGWSTGNWVSTTGLASDSGKRGTLDGSVAVDEPAGSSWGCESCGWGECCGGDETILGRITSERIDGWWRIVECCLCSCCCGWCCCWRRGGGGMVWEGGGGVVVGASVFVATEVKIIGCRLLTILLIAQVAVDNREAAWEDEGSRWWLWEYQFVHNWLLCELGCMYEYMCVCWREVVRGNKWSWWRCEEIREEREMCVLLVEWDKKRRNKEEGRRKKRKDNKEEKKRPVSTWTQLLLFRQKRIRGDDVRWSPGLLRMFHLAWKKKKKKDFFLSRLDVDIS